MKLLVNLLETYTTFLPENALRISKAKLPSQTPSWEKPASDFLGLEAGVREKSLF